MRKRDFSGLVVEDTGGGCIVELMLHKPTGWMITLSDEVLSCYMKQPVRLPILTTEVPVTELAEWLSIMDVGSPVPTIHATGERTIGGEDFNPRRRSHRRRVGADQVRAMELLEEICLQICEWWAISAGPEGMGNVFAIFLQEEDEEGDPLSVPGDVATALANCVADRLSDNEEWGSCADRTALAVWIDDHWDPVGNLLDDIMERAEEEGLLSTDGLKEMSQ